MLTRLALIVFALAAVPAFACDHPQAGETQQNGNERRYQAHGTVREVRDDRIEIQHDAVEGYMPAMTMPFFVRNASQKNGIRSGMEVNFTFAVTAAGRHEIVSITPVAAH